MSTTTRVLLFLLLAPPLLAASIHSAAKKGEIDRVRRHVADQPNSLNDRDWWGRTALHYAAREGHSELVRALLTMGADTSVKDRAGRRAADFAKPDDATIAELLAPKTEPALPPPPKATPKQHESPLYQAVARNRTLAAQELIQAGAKVEPELLALALRYRNFETTKLLLTHGADPNATDRRGHPMLYEALRGRQPEIAELLIANGANLNAKTKDHLSLVEWAIQNGQPEAAALLLRHGAKPSTPHPAQLVNAIHHKPADDTRALALLESHPEWAKAEHRGQPLLIIAISQRRISIASKIIALGADTNASAAFGRSPLHAAAEIGDPELIAQLIAAGAAKDARDHRGRSSRDLPRLSPEVLDALTQAGVPRFTALHDAIAQDDLTAAKAAFAESATLEIAAADGHTPLLAARKSPTITQWLIDQGAKTDAVDRAGRSALHLAVAEDQAQVASILIDAGLAPDLADNSGLRPIHFAKSPAIVALLAQHKVDLQTPAGPFKRSPMAEALRHRREGVVQALVDAGAEFAGPEVAEALLKAAERGDIPTMRTLLQRGVSITATDRAGRSALHRASAALSEVPAETIDFLLKHGADVNAADKSQQSPVHAAASRHHLDLIKTIAAAGADLQARDRSQQTPLHLAANAHRSDSKTVGIIKYFITQGAPPNPRDIHGRTPLDILESRLRRSSGQREVIDALAALGARRGALFPKRLNPPLHVALATDDSVRAAEILAKNPAATHLRDDQGRSPLHLAAAHGNAEIANTLISLGAKIAAPDEFSRTPLHAAAHAGQFGLIQLLLANGAKADAPDLGGFSPAELAKQRRFEECIAALTAQK